MAKRKANEIEAQAITDSGKKIIKMSNQKDAKCDRLFLLTSEMEGGIPITFSTRFLTSKLSFFLRLSPHKEELNQIMSAGVIFM